MSEPKTVLAEIAELADELTDSQEHIELIYGWTQNRHRKLLRKHKYTRPGLLQELRDAIHTPTPADTDNTTTLRPIPGSKPPLLLEALARLIDIETSSNRWIWLAGIPNRGRAESNIRALVGAAANMISDQQHELLQDLRRWRAWAAVMSGWALPPYQPRINCPMPDCGQHSTIRIILERKTGLCVACQTIWTEWDGTINLLAAYIKTETDQPHHKIPIRSTVAGHGGWQTRAGSNT